MIYCTLRTREEQAVEYAKGRETPGPIVTNARPGFSYHNYAVAWDAIPWEIYMRDPDKALTGVKLDWTPFKNKEQERRFRQTMDLGLLDKRWRIMAEAAGQLGIDWAGFWTSMIEYCHWQFTNGLTIDDFRRELDNG